MVKSIFEQGVDRAVKDHPIEDPDTTARSLCEAIGLFVNDPPDTPFINGYLCGLAGQLVAILNLDEDANH